MVEWAAWPRSGGNGVKGSYEPSVLLRPRNVAAEFGIHESVPE